MTRRWVRRFGAVALATVVVFGTANCGRDITAPETPTFEQTPTETELFGLGGWFNWLFGGGDSNDDGGEVEDAGQYTLIQEPTRRVGLLELLLSTLLGSNGGLLSLLGHSIAVPAGAVDGPALFSIEVENEGIVEVDLSATRISLLGGLIDIGAQGFDRPVTLTLSYARATNVEDPDDLVILRRLPGGGFEELPTTVNKWNKTVSAKLEHFSGYCMAAN